MNLKQLQINVLLFQAKKIIKENKPRKKIPNQIQKLFAFQVS